MLTVSPASLLVELLAGIAIGAVGTFIAVWQLGMVALKRPDVRESLLAGLRENYPEDFAPSKEDLARLLAPHAADDDRCSACGRPRAD